MSDKPTPTTLPLGYIAAPDEVTRPWRTANAITDWEFAEIGKLLCLNDPRDLALMVVRLQGRLGMAQTLRAPEVSKA